MARRRRDDPRTAVVARAYRDRPGCRRLGVPDDASPAASNMFGMEVMAVVDVLPNDDIDAARPHALTRVRGVAARWRTDSGAVATYHA